MNEAELKPKNRIVVKPDGPLVFEGDLTLIDADGAVLSTDNTLYLCRCGQSESKPFCDGAHKQAGFQDPAEFNDERADDLESLRGALTITVKANAMYSVLGPVSIQSEDGQSVTTRSRAALCRCGESDNKPFCDISHRNCNFRDD